MNQTRNFAKIFRAGIIGFLILLASGGFADAQEKTTKAADEVFADLSKAGSPGCALLVARGGKIIYKNGYGLANIEEAVAITPQTVFDIGSTNRASSPCRTTFANISRKFPITATRLRFCIY